MAVIDRAFSTVPLYTMEYDQTSHPFLQRTNTPGIADASVNGQPVSELGQINRLPMVGGVNSNGSYYMHNQLGAHPGENGRLFLGGAGQNQSPAGIPALSQITCIGHPGRSRKHKRQEENNSCPLKKRRISASPIPPVFQDSAAPGIFTGRSGEPFWASCPSQVKAAAIGPTLTVQSPAVMHPVPTEDMEDVVAESQSDAALRRIRDIESRLVVEDEEDEDHNSSRDGHLPILVMSDLLVEGFKKGLDESLTKKIVASINRPSMELVLWKPQPQFLANKFESVARNCETNKGTAKKLQRTPIMPVLQEVNPLGVDEPCTSNLDCDIDAMWNREEEEMEL